MSKDKKDDYQPPVDVIREGDKIVLPTDLSIPKAIRWLERRMEEEEEVVNVREETDYYPLDGAQALMKVLSRRYGWVGLTPTPGFFGPQPPKMISMEVGAGETIQVAWGRITLPAIEGYIETDMDWVRGQPVFVLSGTVKQKSKHHIKAIADDLRRSLSESSAYRGKALRIDFEGMDATNKSFDVNQHIPHFMDISKVKEDELILPGVVEGLVKSCLFTPIEKTQRVRDLSIPLKRGVLLEGPYGTGKTLTAYVTAKKAVENGWTFVYLESAAHLEHAVRFAQKYAPAVIFAEDIDRVIAGEERTTEMDCILNVIDGIDSKSSEIMVILTTNAVENINQAMLRPGRLDAVINFTPPDSAAAIRLVQLYSRGMLGENEDLEPVGRALHGQIPAVIREVVERSKLYALSHGTDLQLVAEDLKLAADGMVQHLELLKKKEPDHRSAIEKFGDAVGKEIGSALSSNNGNGHRPVLTAHGE